MKTWSIRRLVVLAVLLALLGLSVQRMVLAQASAAQQRAWAEMPEWQEMWVGDFGIKVRVSNPSFSMDLDRRVQYLDMGPNAPGLKDDRAPATAVVEVNGTQIPMRWNESGVLECTVAASLVRLFRPNHVTVRGWDERGTELATFELRDVIFF